MGIDSEPGLAFVKSQLAAGTTLLGRGDRTGRVFLSLADRDKDPGMDVARLLSELGFAFVATAGTARALAEAGIEVAEIAARIDEGGRTAVTLIEEGSIDLVINTPRGRGARADGSYIRTAAAQTGVPLMTTVAAALAAARGLTIWERQDFQVRSLQEIHRAGRQLAQATSRPSTED